MGRLTDFYVDGLTSFVESLDIEKRKSFVLGFVKNNTMLILVLEKCCVPLDVTREKFNEIAKELVEK